MLNLFRDNEKYDRDQELPDIPSSSFETDQDLYRQELHDTIQKAISYMPEKRQHVFRLCFLEQFTYKEAAETLKVSVKTIENHMGLALKDLRESLSETAKRLFIISFRGTDNLKCNKGEIKNSVWLLKNQNQKLFTMYLQKLFTPLLFLASLLLIITGCNLANSDNETPKDVAVTMQIQTSATAAKFKAQSVDSLTEIKFVVEELELESATEDSMDFEVENLIVNLPLDGSRIQLTSQAIPAGFYDEFELEIEHDEDAQLFDDPDFYDGDTRFSIVIKGSYNGEEFMFRSQEDFEIELELNPALEISENAGSPQVAINIDTSLWFLDAQGNPLDPTDPANYITINENIEQSFDAEADEDDDDDDDNDDD